jgi:hypothetical protein
MKRILAVAAVMLVVLVGGQGEALAVVFEKPFEDNIAVAAHVEDPNGEQCQENWVMEPPPFLWTMVAKGCFTRYGDVWAIQDSFGDTYQTFIYWENWIRDGASWRPYRYGECSNNLGAPNWGKCNKDYYESSSTNFYGGTGSRIRFQVCRRQPWATTCNPGSINDAAWINNNA